jgi:hypothetical protein
VGIRLSPITPHFDNAKIQMDGVNNVCVVMQKHASPTSKRQHFFLSYLPPFVGSNSAYVKERESIFASSLSSVAK